MTWIVQIGQCRGMNFSLNPRIDKTKTWKLTHHGSLEDLNQLFWPASHPEKKTCYKLSLLFSCLFFFGCWWVNPADSGGKALWKKNKKHRPSCQRSLSKIWIKCFRYITIICNEPKAVTKHGTRQIHNSYWVILYLILYPFLRDFQWFPAISMAQPAQERHIYGVQFHPEVGSNRSCRKTIWGWQGQCRYPALNILRGARDQQYQLDLVNDCWSNFCHWYFRK